MTPAKLYSCETLLQRLAQDLKDMAAELWQFVQEEDAVVGQRHFTGHRHVAPADQSGVGDRVMRGGTRARGDHRRAGAREAGEPVDSGCLKGFREGHGGQNGNSALY
jgi:hypothetical protein